MKEKYYIVSDDYQGNNPHIISTESSAPDFEMAGPFNSFIAAQKKLNKMGKNKMTQGGGVGKYEKLVKDNWDEITYSYETGGSKLPKTISSGDAEGFLEEFDDSFSNMSEEEQSKAIKEFKMAFSNLRGKKMTTGGELNEMFPENDAMSYEYGGSTSNWCYSIGGL
jgi:hypothetical protein